MGNKGSPGESSPTIFFIATHRVISWRLITGIHEWVKYSSKYHCPEMYMTFIPVWTLVTDMRGKKGKTFCRIKVVVFLSTILSGLDLTL